MEVKELIIGYEEAIKYKKSSILQIKGGYDKEVFNFIEGLKIEIDLLAIVIKDLKDIK
jgi:hypothetical protein